LFVWSEKEKPDPYVYFNSSQLLEQTNLLVLVVAVGVFFESIGHDETYEKH
jgi:hypothetical protein